MNKLPRMFTSKRQSKSMDQSLETQSPSSSPRHRLVRKNAARNYDYYPSNSLPSSSLSSSTSSTSSAPRTRSLDLNHSSDRSLQIKGNDGQLGRVCESLGLRGPEDFEIPKEIWEAFRVSSADVVQQTKTILWDDGEMQHPEPVEARVEALELSREVPCVVQPLEVDGRLKQPCVPDRFSNSFTGKGILGVRPPSLNVPPVSPHGADVCSPQNTVNEPAPGGEDADLYPPTMSIRRGSSSQDDYDPNGNVGVRPRNTIPDPPSDNTSVTSHDPDSSSSSTDNSPVVRARFNITNWQKGNRLGQGSFGTVYEGFCSDGIFFAIKEVSLHEQGVQGGESILSLQKEIDMLSMFRHKNIVQYLGTETDDANLYIFLELVTKGSLASLYRIYVFPDSVVAAYTRQILSGLKYLHERNIVHRDIKCANILVASSGTVKLADFGLAKAVKLNDLKSCKGTALWMAPEVVDPKKQGYGTAADIWSLGCTVLEMSTGQLPYHPLDPMQALFRIGNGKPPPVPKTLSTDLRNFILKCLQVNPDARPSAAELLEDPFMRKRSSLDAESPATGGWHGR